MVALFFYSFYTRIFSFESDILTFGRFRDISRNQKREIKVCEILQYYPDHGEKAEGIVTWGARIVCRSEERHVWGYSAIYFVGVPDAAR